MGNKEHKDPFTDDYGFEQCSPVPPSEKPTPDTGYYKVIVPSEWTNEHSGASGTSWTEVGVAFKLRGQEGWKLSIRKNLSITGDVLILPRSARDS
jgi:hypothetical protein